MFDNREILEAARRLADEQPHLLGDDAKQITEWLNQTPENDPEALRQTVNLLLDRLSRHSEAWQAVCREVGIDEDNKDSNTRLSAYFDNSLGDPPPIPASTKMVCPECDYHRTLRQKGQRLFCPNCDKQLVPEVQSS
ncbi:MAG: hypothetical protein DRI57_03770 [Deltaproteobacteria bacterium]|nr:MAG: hypothetical protein DRI57_03770 [Deltaproteobacteria bacterium]